MKGLLPCKLANIKSFGIYSVPEELRSEIPPSGSRYSSLLSFSSRKSARGETLKVVIEAQTAPERSVSLQNLAEASRAFAE